MVAGLMVRPFGPMVESCDRKLHQRFFDFMNTLLNPIRVGAMTLPNRVLMAPLTRCRAGDGRVPTRLMAEYYRQRAGAGLIITEATAVMPMGVGYPDTPGIWSQDQVKGWKRVTEAVHAEGGQIVLQLWHVGRISDPEYLNGELPVAPSAIRPDGYVHVIRPKRNYVTPRALELDEIPEVVEAFRHGAENAKAAGFDGVEVHGANGYLLNQFLNSASNVRTDRYGGSIENRARLMLEVIDAAISVWGANRVGLHISPGDHEHSMGKDNSLPDYEYVMREAGQRRIAFVCAREAFDEPNRKGSRLKQAFGGIYIANEGFTQATGEEIVARGEADAVAYGRDFIANPDLPLRFAKKAALNQQNPLTFYPPLRDIGYTDYPALNSDLIAA
jgi:2,4-dienoyl-CoA reductase-like NADH-dependent reductase (Old Yellow Enzyme family)